MVSLLLPGLQEKGAFGPSASAKSVVVLHRAGHSRSGEGLAGADLCLGAYLWCYRHPQAELFGDSSAWEALLCGKLRKTTTKYLKIPAGLFLSQSSGQPDGFGVCSEVPVDACQSARLSHVSQRLQFCCWTELSVPSPLVCSLDLSAASERCGQGQTPLGAGVRWSGREAVARHEERGYSPQRVGRSVSFCRVFILHYLKQKKTQPSRAGVAPGCWLALLPVPQQTCLYALGPEEEALARVCCPVWGGRGRLWVLSTALGPSWARLLGSCATCLLHRPLQLLLLAALPRMPCWNCTQ